MRWSLTILGRVVCVVECERDSAEVLAAAIAELTDDTDTDIEDEDYLEEDTASIAGGSSHNFELDPNRNSPDDRYAPWEDHFGFH